MKHKYLFGFLLCLLGMCLYLFHIIYAEAKEKAISELNSRQMIHARQAQRGIEDFFSNLIASLTRISESDAVADLDDRGWRELDVAISINPEAIAAVTRVDASGKIVYTTPYDAALIGKDISGQNHVREIMKTHRPVVSDIFTAVQGYKAIAVEVPVLSRGEYRGALTALINFQAISKRFLQEIRVGETGYAWMMNREGTELYCPVPGHTGKSVFENCKDFPTILSMAKEMMRGSEGTTTYLFDRILDRKPETVKKHAVYLPIKIGDNFWSIVVASSEEELLASLVSFRNKLIGVFGLLLFGSAFFFYYGMKARWLIREAAERQKAGETLRESEQKFRAVFEQSLQLVGLMAVDGTLLTANTSALMLAGVTAADVVGKPFWETPWWIHSAELQEGLRSAVEKAARGEYVCFEAAHPGRDGNTHYIETSIRPVVNEAGRVIFLVPEGRDITERKRVEAALRESEEKFRTLVEKSPLGISLIGKDGRYKYVNPRFMDMFGYTIEDISTGAEWFEKAYPDEADRRTAVETWIADQQKVGPGQIRPRVFTVTCKDGSRKEIFFRPVAMENHDQFVLYEDITEKSEMEQQLQQARKYEAIGTLAGGIAHDFNNLLMGIQGNASLIRMGLTSSHPHLEYVNAIEECIRSGASLTRQLLGFARGGKYEVKPIDMNAVVLNSSAMFGRTRKEIRIHTETQPAPPVVNADRGQIEQVLLNLYVNAWQAMPEGGELSIDIKIVTLDEAFCKPHQVKPGRYCRVSVTDTGIGMDETTRQRIFDPFFTTKQKSRGTGLGLASAYGIIKNHGGMITVQSEAGRGATFTIFLPVSDKEMSDEAPVEGRLIRGSGTILVVDDEDMILEVGQALLEALGYCVLIAKGGEQAVEVIQNTANRIDLVILDLIMPGMDGGKTFDRIQQLWPGMPVMLSSGYAISGEANEILRRGCKGFIQKPFNISELSKKVREMLPDSPKRL